MNQLDTATVFGNNRMSHSIISENLNLRLRFRLEIKHVKNVISVLNETAASGWGSHFC